MLGAVPEFRMRIGKLRERITIQALTETPDATGEAIKSWADVAKNPTVWGRAEFLFGREMETMKRINEDISMAFTIRFRTDLESGNAELKYRLQWDNRNWNIHSVQKDENREWFRIVASQVA